MYLRLWHFVNLLSVKHANTLKQIVSQTLAVRIYKPLFIYDQWSGPRFHHLPVHLIGDAQADLCGCIEGTIALDE